jgi:hypothetical protein
MSQSTQKTSPKANDAALAAFVARKTEIDTMLTRLQALSDDHFGLARRRSPGATSPPSPTTPSC